MDNYLRGIYVCLSICILLISIFYILYALPVQAAGSSLVIESATPGTNTQSPTPSQRSPSQSFTPTLTSSVTSTSGTPAQTISPSQTRSLTTIPGTPTQIFSPSATPSLTPTTTLMPLPELTLIFPAQTSTSTTVETPGQVSIPGTKNPSGEAEFNNLSPRIRILSILIVLLWLFLVGFVIIYIRQFR